jgi:hypothetical protein
MEIIIDKNGVEASVSQKLGFHVKPLENIHLNPFETRGTTPFYAFFLLFSKADRHKRAVVIATTANAIHFGNLGIKYRVLFNGATKDLLNSNFLYTITNNPESPRKIIARLSREAGIELEERYKL